MEYDRSDSLPFDFFNQMEFNFVHNLKEKLLPRSYSFHEFDSKWKSFFFVSVPNYLIPKCSLIPKNNP